ncbi:MAG: right-handed parallel beta-helix repeat-containing protein [Gemmataceae bacterium]|nr:right-handed parallel beta-helix repeat-containing protein [Gemmataceae bacterium]
MSIARHFGAKGDGRTDDTAALSHALQQGDGHLELPRGDYLITKPLYIPLDQHGRICIDGSGGTAKLIMAGPGPAIYLVGSHKKSALPADFADGVWKSERMPTVQSLEIEGRHPEADGVRIEGAMQPTLLGVLIRKCRHGVHIIHRDRNVLIANCHIYDNSGVGVFLDRVNLHQINITGNHISYCKGDAIKVSGSEIRNLQINGNDIEYSHNEKAATSEDILLDAREGTIREGAIIGNTIQAKPSPNGANVRLLGVGNGKNTAVGMVSITGNVIGDQIHGVDLRSCRGVIVSANSIYGGIQYALRVEDSEHIVIGPNSIDHNSDYKGKTTDRVLFRNCRNVTMTGLILQHTLEPEEEPAASVEIDRCENVSLTGCEVLGARNRGVLVRDSSVVRVAGSTIRPRPDDRRYKASVSVEGKSTHVMIVNNFVGKGSEGDVQMAQGTGNAAGNVIV